MAYVFTPPTVEEGPAGGGPLFSRYRIPRGITVLLNGSTYSEVRWPTDDEIEAADAVYRGGYRHEVTDEEAASLTTGGYGSYLTEVE